MTNGSGPKRSSGRIEIGGAPAPASPAPAPVKAARAPAKRAAAPAAATPAEWPAGSTATVYEPHPRSAPAAPPADAPPAPEATARTRAADAPYTPRYSQSKRRPADQRENAFQGLAWLLEGVTGIAEELRHSDMGLNEEFWVHAYAARRESLLALRAVVDLLIEKTDAADRQEEERRQRRERRGGIQIE